MITPSFGLTATERILPRLALDFTTASLDSRVTFTRAGNTATVVNSSGLVAPINADLPRFDFNPTTLACNGLLIEEARTNNLVYSEQFDNALWNKTDTTITANSINAPSGALTAELATEGSAGSSNVAQAITITANSTNTFSVFLKRGNTDWIRFVIWDSVNNANRISAWVNLSTGALGATVVNGGTSTGGAATISNFNNGWYRVTLSGAVNNAAVLLNCLFSSAASDGVVTRVNGATYYVWGAQTESGTFPTSYIPTVASTVTRTADVAQMTGANFSSWFNASEGAFVTWFNIPIDLTTGFPTFVCASDGTTANRMVLTSNAGGNNLNLETIVGGVAQVGFFPSYVSGSTKVAYGFKLNNSNYGKDGVTGTTDTACTVPVVNRLNIGSNQTSGNLLNGYVQKVFFYPQRIINAELAAFSK